MNLSELNDIVRCVLLESREEDLQRLAIAEKSFDDVVGYVSKLKTLRDFEAKFKKDKAGRLVGFSLGGKLPRDEHFMLSVYFQDRASHGIKPTIKARAGRYVGPFTGRLTSLYVIIFFDAPPATRKAPRAFNAWFAKNLATILQDPAIRSSYVHEFTHTLDFRRISTDYLLKRAQKKREDIDSRKQTGQRRDFKVYANDPLEMNAHFQQALSKVKYDIEHGTVKVGTSPQEFTNMFMNTYLKKTTRDNLNDVSRRKIEKRIATAWEHLKDLQPTYPTESLPDER